MRSKERWYYVVAVGVLVGIIIGMCLSPLKAQQNRWVELGNVTCTSLTVVDEAGNHRVRIDALETGGNIEMWGASESSSVWIFADGSGGDVSVRGKDGSVSISTGSRWSGLLPSGPKFSVRGRGGSVAIEIDDNKGKLVVSDKDKSPRVRLQGDKYGGMVGVYDEDEDLRILD